MAAGFLRYLIDTSAVARFDRAEVQAAVAPLLLQESIGSCGVIELEVLYSARTHAHFVGMLRELRSYPRFDVEQADFDRAVDVMELLARRGQHRAARLPDLLLAAIAERAGLTLIHYDTHFDLIAEVTGQAMLWVVPRGSVP